MKLLPGTIFSPDHITQILLCGIKSMCSHHLEWRRLVRGHVDITLHITSKKLLTKWPPLRIRSRITKFTISCIPKLKLTVGLNIKFTLNLCFWLLIFGLICWGGWKIKLLLNINHIPSFSIPWKNCNIKSLVNIKTSSIYLSVDTELLQLKLRSCLWQWAQGWSRANCS